MGWPEYLTEQQRRNESTRAHRDAFFEHRQRVMHLLLSARRDARDRLCILAAGNGNDIDLDDLSRHYREVHLVDADGRALAHAVRQAGCEARSNVVPHAELDLTGIADQLGGGSSCSRATAADVRELMARSRAFECPALPGPFEVVASTCLLSQLVDAVVAVVPHDRADCLPLILEVRRRHLELMLELLADGGRGILIVDFVSSATFPELMTVPLAHLPAAAQERIDRGDFFTGVNPFAVHRWFVEQQAETAHTGAPVLHQPWRWDVGPIQFAVTAITFERRGSSPPPHEGDR